MLGVHFLEDGIEQLQQDVLDAFFVFSDAGQKLNAFFDAERDAKVLSRPCIRVILLIGSDHIRRWGICAEGFQNALGHFS